MGARVSGPLCHPGVEEVGTGMARGWPPKCAVMKALPHVCCMPGLPLGIMRSERQAATRLQAGPAHLGWGEPATR